MKKRILATLTALCLAMVLFGCGGATGPSSGGEASGTSDGDVTIRMWTFLDPTNTDNGRSVALKQMMDEFEAENPGVKVVVEPQDWTTMTAKFMAAATTDMAPDLMWCARDELYGVLNAGALEPLENLFMKDWTAEEINDVDDGFFQFGERDGKHYTLTLNKNCTGLFYREDLLEAAGLEVPTTFDELYDAAVALTGKEESGIDRYGLGMSFSTESNDAQAIINWLLQENGDLFNDDGTANWANDAGVAAIEWTQKCIDDGVTPSESVNTTIEDIYTEFAAGKYAMAIASAVRLANLRETASFDGSTIQFAPLPGATIIDGWFVGVWSGSPHKEEAGKFLEKMYSPESDLKWIELGGQAPNRKSTVESLEITDENKYMEAMLQAFGEGWLPSNTEAYVGWKLDLNYPIQSVLTDGTDPMKALQDAEKIFNTDNNR
jgi:multiple sugar transport system substrate-binding protein